LSTDCRLLDRRCRLVELRQGRKVQARLLLQVAPDDQIALGMRAEPTLTSAHQLLDLGLVHPVVLVVIEHREQHIKVIEQIG
jgi:hypothetical protein